MFTSKSLAKMCFDKFVKKTNKGVKVRMCANCRNDFYVQINIL